MKKFTVIFCFVFACATVSAQSIINVPGDQPTIQAGIDAASDGDTVLVAENTYFENINFNGKAITVASLYIMDADTNHINNTIIDGSQATDPDSASTVMFVSGEDTTSVVSGFTITGGSGVFEVTWNIQVGGGIYCYNSGCRIINNRITGNHVENDTAGGAGICCFMNAGDHWSIIDNNTINHNTSIAHEFSAFGGGMSVLSNSIITNNTIEYNTCTNTLQGADGGGIEIERMPGLTISSIIRNNIIRYNEIAGGTDAMGAGIMSFGVPAVIENNIIEGNSAVAPDNTWGGGIAVFNSEEGIAINSNTIRYNWLDATSSYGSGIELYNCGVTTINNNDISNNSGYASNYMAGGGIWIHTANDTVRIENNEMYYNTISAGINSIAGATGIYITNLNRVIFNRNKVGNNISNIGGGLYTFNTYNSAIINNLFYENESSNGGAVYFRQYDGDDKMPGGIDEDKKPPINNHLERGATTPLLINNTFYGNTSSYSGGAIYSDHTLAAPIVFNSIFWGNEAAVTGNNIFCNSQEDVFVAYCDIDTLGIAGNWQGHSNIFKDPLFTDSLCHIIGPTSPCADVGTDSISHNGLTFYCPTEDYEGESRPYGNGIPDIGADETDIWVGIITPQIPGHQVLVVDPIHPNPFSNSTVISWQLDNGSYVELGVYDITGKQVATLVSEKQAAGSHQYEWTTEDLPAGIYFYKLTAGNQAAIGKMVLLR